MILYYLLLIAISLLSVYFVWCRRKLYKLSWQLDGPLWFPILGNAWYFLDFKYVIRNVCKLRKEYKPPMRFWLGPKLFVHIAIPEHMEKVLRAPECINKSYVYSFLKNFVGDGLFTLGSEKWAHHRKLINPTFNNKILLSFFPIINEQTNVLVSKMNECINKGSICLTNLLMKYNMDLSAQTTMGVKLNIQNNENADILEAFKLAKKITGLRVFSPWLQPEFLFKLSKWYKLQVHSRNVLQNFTKNLIQKKLAYKSVDSGLSQNITSRTKSDDKILKNDYIFIDQAINLVCDKNQFTWEDVQNESNVIVAAAVDTTAVTLTYLITNLAIHPQYQEKVIEEIAMLFPNNDFEVSFEDTKNMVYCDMVINETLRLFPTVPFTARHIINDFKLTEEITIPAGTDICLDFYSLHRNEKYWGADAHQFNPERFITLSNDMHPYMFLPFSKGPRNCIGWRYSIFNLKICMAKIFKKFRFTTNQKLEDFQFRMEITLKSLIDPLVEVHKI